MKYKQVHSRTISNERLARTCRRVMTHSKRLMGAGIDRIERRRVVNVGVNRDRAIDSKWKDLSGVSFTPSPREIVEQRTHRQPRDMPMKQRASRSAPSKFRPTRIIGNAMIKSEALSATQIHVPTNQHIVVPSNLRDVKSNGLCSSIKHQVASPEDLQAIQTDNDPVDVCGVTLNVNSLSRVPDNSENKVPSSENRTRRKNGPKIVVPVKRPPKTLATTPRIHHAIKSTRSANARGPITRSKSGNTRSTILTRRRSAELQRSSSRQVKRPPNNSSTMRKTSVGRIIRSASRNRSASIVGHKNQPSNADTNSVSKYIHNRVSKLKIKAKSNEKKANNITSQINTTLPQSSVIRNSKNKCLKSTTVVAIRNNSIQNKSPQRTAANASRLNSLRPRSAPAIPKKLPNRAISPPRQKCAKPTVRYSALPKHGTSSVTKYKRAPITQSATKSKHQECRENCTKDNGNGKFTDHTINIVKRRSSKLSDQPENKQSRMIYPNVHDSPRNLNEINHNFPVEQISRGITKTIKPIIMKTEVKTETLTVHKNIIYEKMKNSKPNEERRQNVNRPGKPKIIKPIAVNRKMKVRKDNKESQIGSCDRDKEENEDDEAKLCRELEIEPKMTTEPLSEFVINWLNSIPNEPEITSDMLNYYTEA